VAYVEQRKELPDAFLRRCFFHYIRPDPDTCGRSHGAFPRHQAAVVARAQKLFYEIREVPPEEEAIDLGIARLAEAVDVEDIGLETFARAAIQETDPAAAWR